MGNFSNMAITDSGRVLYADVQAGAVLVPTKITIGSGSLPAGKTTASMTDVVNAIKDLTINKRKRSNDGKATFGGVYSNTDITQAFYFRELALYCKAEYRDDSGTVTQEVGEVLYAYGNAGDAADYMPAYSTNTVVEKQIDIVVWVGNDAAVELIVESGVFMTQEQLNAALAEIRTNISDTINNHVNDTTGNPHNINAEDVGLGNVPNVTPENQKPVFSETVTSVTTADDGTKSLPNILNGDVMGVILQKIRSAISAFIAHLNAKNPHGLGASDVGAAASTHYHAASDINEGTLSLLRGGTGGTTAEEARTNIGAAASNHTHSYAGSSSAGGAANSAVKLSTARKVTVNLASESGADFDGSKEITPGVSGILPIKHGGLGASTVEEAQKNLGIVALDELPNLYVWKKCSGDYSPYKETALGKTSVTLIATTLGNDSSSVSYASEITISNGEVALVDPQELVVTRDGYATDCAVLKGKYIDYYAIKRIPSTASFSRSADSAGTTIYASSAYEVTVNTDEREFLGYVASKDGTTYPNEAEHTDGYWYIYHKQLGE